MTKSRIRPSLWVCVTRSVFFLVMVLDSTSLNKSYLCLKHELPINVAFYRSGCRDYLFSCKIVMSGRTILKVEFKCFKSHTLHLSIKTRYLRAFVWYSFFTIFNFISDFFFSTYIILNLRNYMIRAIVCNVFIRSNLCIIEKP